MSTLPADGSVLPITRWGEDVMHRVNKPVTEFGDELQKLVADMVATMNAAEGVGLAANQVGVLRRVFTWQLVGDEETPPEHGIYVNPEILETSAETQEDEEGCLSFPGLFYPTVRPLRATLKACRPCGMPQRL